MAFRFSLAAVLKLREEMEKREERVLQQRRDALARLRAQLAEAKRGRRHMAEQRLVQLQRGILGDDLNYTIAQEKALEHMQHSIERAIPEAMRMYEQQLQVFLAARRDREVLDELKSTRRETWEEEMARKEQSTIDDIFASRYNRKL